MVSICGLSDRGVRVGCVGAVVSGRGWERVGCVWFELIRPSHHHLGSTRLRLPHRGQAKDGGLCADLLLECEDLELEL